MLAYLVNPANKLVSISLNKSSYWNRYRLWKPLGLLMLAGLTPAGWEISILDENLGPIDYAALPRPAYEIADAFRRRSIPVVLGGIHPTVLPDEAGEHADAVVVGEAETVWREVIADLRTGRLKPRYQAEAYHDLVGLPVPRRDLLRADRYLTVNVVQTARGCPNGCTFCTVRAVFGRRYRFRPIPEVVDELRTLGGWVGFVDDNIVGHPARARELFEALIPMKRQWIGQGDLSVAKDPELLRLCARSGCSALFVGLDTLTPEGLRATHKSPNLACDMSEAIATIHKAGIEIVGSFVLGLDQDDTDVFARTAAFAE